MTLILGTQLRPLPETLLQTGYLVGPMLIWALLRIFMVRPAIRVIFAAWWMFLGCAIETGSTPTTIIFSIASIVLTIVVFGFTASLWAANKFSVVMATTGMTIVTGEIFLICSCHPIVTAFVWSLIALPIAIAERSWHPQFWRKGARYRAIDVVVWSVFGCLVAWNLFAFTTWHLTGFRFDCRPYEWNPMLQYLLLLAVSFALPSRRVIPMFLVLIFNPGLLSIHPRIYGPSHLSNISDGLVLYSIPAAIAFVIDEFCGFLERRTPEADMGNTGVGSTKFGKLGGG